MADIRLRPNRHIDSLRRLLPREKDCVPPGRETEREVLALYLTERK